MGISIKSTMALSWLIFPLVSSSILVNRTDPVVQNVDSGSSSSSSFSKFDFTTEHSEVLDRVEHTLEVEICKTDIYQNMCCQRILPEMGYLQRLSTKYGPCPATTKHHSSSSSSSSSKPKPAMISLLGWTVDDILAIMINKDSSTTSPIGSTTTTSISSSSSSSTLSNTIYSYITACESTDYFHLALFMLLVTIFLVGCFRLRSCNCYIVPVDSARATSFSFKKPVPAVIV